MATLPQLIEDDIGRLDEALCEFIAAADATIAALSSGAFMANQTIAGLVNETNFNSIYQQGEKFSLFVINVDDNCMLVVIFKSQTGVGVVKYFAATAVKRIACQLSIAHDRAPGAGLDLSVLNVADTGQFFRKK